MITEEWIEKRRERQSQIAHIEEIRLRIVRAVSVGEIIHPSCRYSFCGRLATASKLILKLNLLVAQFDADEKKREAARCGATS